jgi:hypothetical protein
VRCWPDQWRYRCPFCIGHVRGVTQTTLVRRTPMLRRPRHPSAPAKRSRDQRIKTDLADSTSSRRTLRGLSSDACSISSTPLNLAACCPTALDKQTLPKFHSMTRRPDLKDQIYNG